MTIPICPPIGLKQLKDLAPGAVFMGLGHNSRFYMKLNPGKADAGLPYYLSMDPVRITAPEVGLNTLSTPDLQTPGGRVLALTGQLEADLSIIPSQIDAHPAAAPAGALVIGESFHALRVGPHASGMYINLTSFEIGAGLKGPCAVMRKWSLRLVQPATSPSGLRDRSKDLILIDVDIP